MLVKLRCPDDVPADPHAPEHIRNRLPLTRRTQPQPVQTPCLNGAAAKAQYPLINRAPQRGPGKSTHRRHR